jgi:hypothetical protein
MSPAVGWLALATAGLQLHWVAPPECPAASELRREVGDLVGDRAWLTRVDLVVSATVTQNPWRADLEVRTRGRRSTRRFQGESCAALFEATSVILALAVTEAAREEPSVASRSPVSAGLTLAAIRVRWPWEPSLSVETASVFGVTPGPVIQLQAGGAVRRGWWEIGAGGWVRPPWVRGVERNRFAGGGGTLSACVLRARRRWEVAGCADAELGTYRVDGTGTLWFAGGPTAAVRVAGGPWWWGLKVGALFPRIRPEVRGETTGTLLYQPDTGSVRLSFSVSRRFR